MNLERTNQTKAAITAVGGYVPDTILSNEDLEKMVDTNDAWITSRTGIKERRILKDPNKATSYLAIKAAQDLIDLSKSEYVHKNEIDRKGRLSFQNCDLVDAFTKYEDRIFKSEYPKLKSELIEEKEAISIRRFNRLNKLGN